MGLVLADQLDQSADVLGDILETNKLCHGGEIGGAFDPMHNAGHHSEQRSGLVGRRDALVLDDLDTLHQGTEYGRCPLLAVADRLLISERHQFVGGGRVLGHGADGHVNHLLLGGWTQKRPDGHELVGLALFHGRITGAERHFWLDIPQIDVQEERRDAKPLHLLLELPDIFIGRVPNTEPSADLLVSELLLEESSQ